MEDFVHLISRAYCDLVDDEYNGQCVPVSSIELFFYMSVINQNDLHQMGIQLETFTHRTIEEKMRGVVDENTISSFSMDWVQCSNDPEDGYYEFWIENNI